MIGETLRHYRIETKLGAVGIGVVYRALDIRFDRTVALRVLPRAAFDNAEGRARFAQEAESVSALRHRNIITIYEIDTAEVNGQPVDFIAMEYVPGKTLDKLIGRKGLRLSEALHYAVQIADGLAAAHKVGIVHRDLKPSNIMVNEQGEVKILDFGLTRLNEPDEPDVQAPIQSVQLKTEAGTIVPTVAYMSPEQANGHKADERSDIFSFGAVMYEMITGRRAFASNSNLSTLALVLHEDPPPLKETGERMQSEVARIITRCLRKDPQRRWQRMASLKVVLEDVVQEWGSSKEATEAWTGRRRFPSVFGLALIVIVMLGAGAYVGSKARTASQPTFRRLTFRRGNVSGAKFSPDGQTVLFSAQWSTDPTVIFSMLPGRIESRPLNLPKGRVLSISSSGEMAILLGSSASGVPGTLARVPLSGGAPREILENVNDADWSPDGTSLAACYTVGNHNRIEFPLGTVLYDGVGRLLGLRVSPKGNLLAFFEYDNAIGDYAVTVIDLHGGKRVLSRGWTAEGGLAWSPRGDEIWYSSSRVGGEPALRAVKTNGNERILFEAPGWIVLQDIARDGRVLVTVEDSRVGITGRTPGAREEQDLSWFEASRIYDMSGDGKMILFVEMSYGKPRNTAIYMRKTDGSQAVRLGDGNRPMLSPDGKWVACILNDGPQTTLTLLPTRTGRARTISTAGIHYERVEWFPDGQRILFAGNEPNRSARTFVQDLNGGNPVPLTPEGTDASHVSPNQKYVTVTTAGNLSLFPIGAGEPKVIASLEPGESVIRWSGDGRFLFLRKLEEGEFLKINRLDVAGGRRELWKELKPLDPVGMQFGQVVLTPDGNSYAYSFQRDISILYLAEGLR